MTYQSSPSCLLCSGKAQSGTVATMAYINAKFEFTASLGIYHCRVVAGTNVKSDHACGRAGDSKIPTLSGGKANTALGYQIVDFLDTYSSFLGITYQIYDRVFYDAKTPNGRYYGGVHPHNDHVHWSQSLAKATSLTLAQIIAHCGPLPTTPPPSTDWTDQLIMALPTLRKGDGYYINMGLAPDVKNLQGLLLANGFKDKNSATPESATDGKFWTGTETAVKGFQKAKKLTVDGIAGKNTWTKLLRQ